MCFRVILFDNWHLEQRLKLNYVNERKNRRSESLEPKLIIGPVNSAWRLSAFQWYSVIINGSYCQQLVLFFVSLYLFGLREEIIPEISTGCQNWYVIITFTPILSFKLCPNSPFPKKPSQKWVPLKEPDSKRVRNVTNICNWMRKMRNIHTYFDMKLNICSFPWTCRKDFLFFLVGVALCPFGKLHQNEVVVCYAMLCSLSLSPDKYRYETFKQKPICWPSKNYTLTSVRSNRRVTLWFQIDWIHTRNIQ